ncbi:MAG: GNAT family N-acyltransferase [Candidatus Omnitrophota bacterium]|nr:GNAT family N-acyltransferase [Candidatus Omnitrophota bacterium]
MDVIKEVLRLLRARTDQSQFTFGRVDSPELLNDVFRLRYQIYCMERNFIKSDQCHNGLESDKYDPHSVHFFAADKHSVIATIRLILDSPYGFPFEENCRGGLDIDINAFPKTRIAEISRYTIRQHLKSTKGIAFGLYSEMYRESKHRGITHWFALMERPLYLLLRRYGFEFRPIGKEIEMYGTVIPYMASIEDLEKALCQKSSRSTKD